MAIEKSPETKEPPAPESLPLARFPHLKLVFDTPKGRGVFATTPIPSGTTIDISPVLLLTPQENTTHIEKTSLYHYTYNWPLPSPTSNKPSTTTTQAVVLGLGSMFNHSAAHQNVGWTRDLEREVVVYTALRDVAEGEELCISYGGRLTFVDVEAEAEREGVEGPEEVLGRIEVDG
ncbi:hypothetical protein M409DRAFT_23004 [Zasmidium cellare ATCC 36951]|uniref:SET domain-containing protein n=1 Tax=Zasmidium cellare ATCC 36951 TaxID=1080233 RepID=A0A6A6CL79_ZASCE|nr:uncharacterized protein M409DRAFT_23004 [Zasmidium cellare ATCC 36951]KAF2166958.1 hypothetical protein M409DRAFT_23004 [Zasmidium cellare ATCC 36951]